MARLRIGLSKLPDGALVAKAEHVIEQLTANAAIFTAPNPTVAVLATAKAALAGSMAEALLGLKSAFSQKRERRELLLDLLRQVSQYVSNVANGDPTKIILGGFEVRKRAEPMPLPTVPDMVPTRVSAYTGQVDLKWAASFARSFQVLMTTTDPNLPGAAWSMIGHTTKRSFAVTGLASGTAYWFMVAGVNATGAGPTCKPQMFRAA